MEKHVASDCQSVEEAAKQEMMQLLVTKKMQTLVKKGLKRRAEAVAEAGPVLLENAHSGYALPEQHHRTYGKRTAFAALLHGARSDQERLYRFISRTCV